MKIDKFTLIHAPDTLKSAVKQVREIKKANDLATKQTKAKSRVVKRGADSQQSPRKFSTTPSVANKIVHPTAIGLWDLGAWLGSLYQIIEGLNRCQKAFLFFEVKAAVPLGLTKQPQRAIPKLEEFLESQLSTDEKATVGNNFFAADYYAFGEDVRKDLRMDYLVGITPSMIADTRLHNGEREAAWNLFSTSDASLILVSCYQLREFAEQTGQPFEAFLATIIIAQVLAAKFYPTLTFHPDTGCLFDYNKNRSNIKNKVLSPAIESSCLPKYLRSMTQQFKLY